MARQLPSFEYARCVACAICVQVCPVSCLDLSLSGIDNTKEVYPHLVTDTCIGCGFCARDCPTMTISMIDLVVEGAS